jgi:hypothetical protein
VQPLIPLGTKGQLQGVHWQVVGFQHRMGVEPGDDEHFGWSEYLLYNQKRGFVSWSIPKKAGAWCAPPPARRSWPSNGRTAKLSWAPPTSSSTATRPKPPTCWASSTGRCSAARRPATATFASSKGLLSMEQSRNEITWSAGDKIASDTVAKAFKLEDKKDLLKRSDALHGGAQHRHHPHHRDSDRDPDRAVAAQPLQPLRPARGELLLHHGTKFRRILGWQLQRRGTQMNVFTGGHHGN